MTVGDAILVATRSAGKMRELRALFGAAGRRILSLDDAGVRAAAEEEELETAATFEENALAKARYFHARSGLPTVADDSGIEVLSLGGAPGVRSKRWSARPDLDGQALDDANNALLLERLAGVVDRRARYVCAAAYCDGARAFAERGTVAGRITERARGANGFGYDPYFYVPAFGRTAAELDPAEKNAVSHRGQALKQLVSRLLEQPDWA